jgi:hypothetical protein
MTGHRLMTMQNFSFVRKESAGSGNGPMSTFTLKMESDGGTPTVVMNGEQLDAQKVQELMARAKADADSLAITSDTMVGTRVYSSKGAALAGPAIAKRNAGESLGKQTIEGVTAEGTRTVNTIKAGSIGNDRDIQVTGESWYSPELRMTVMSRHNDPRSGEESFRLININRNEPAAYLFQVPSGYNVNGPEKKF